MSHMKIQALALLNKQHKGRISINSGGKRVPFAVSSILLISQ